MKLQKIDYSEVKPGDILLRVWAPGHKDFLLSKIRVSAVDDKFIYCDAQTAPIQQNINTLVPLPDGSEPWKFDRDYGIETDEEQGWGIEPYGRNIVLTMVVLSDDQIPKVEE